MSHDGAQLLEYLTLAQQAVFFALMTVSTYTDIAKNKVYNWATLPAIVLGPAIWFLSPYHGEKGILNSFAAMGVGGGMFFLFFLFRAVGAGDVKLMAAVGALMGLRFLVNALLPIAIIGALMAVGVMIFRRRVVEGLKSSAKMLVTLRPKKPAEGKPPLTVPYGAAIAIGSMWTWAMLLILNQLPTISRPLFLI